MRVIRKLGAFAAALACINLLVPLQMIQASEQTASQASSPTPRIVAKPVIRDVTLSPTHELRGQLVDRNGARLANRIVVAVHSDKSNMQSVSDAEGKFRFPQAKPGMYQIATSDGSYQTCRCWAPNTAPPVASQTVLLIEGEQTLRGQKPIGELLCGPVLIGLIIAAAIIIPIAIHNSQKTAS